MCDYINIPRNAVAGIIVFKYKYEIFQSVVISRVQTQFNLNY